MIVPNAQPYRESGKFSPLGPLLPMIAAVLLGWPLGFAYAYAVRWIPFVYLNMLLTFGYGALFGFITSQLLLRGRVRNTIVAGATGAAVGLLALYFNWNAHMHTLATGVPLLCDLGGMWRMIQFLYEEGSWSLHGSNVTGIPLAVVWIVEAAIILFFSVFLPYEKIRNTPFCETSMAWLQEEKKISTLMPFTDATQIAALKTGDLTPLVEAKAKPEGADHYTRLTLKSSPKCQLFFTLRIEDVRRTFDNKGNATEKAKPLTPDLVLPPEMFELIEKFAGEMPPATSAVS